MRQDRLSVRNTAAAVVMVYPGLRHELSVEKIAEVRFFPLKWQSWLDPPTGGRMSSNNRSLRQVSSCHVIMSCHHVSVTLLMWICSSEAHILEFVEAFSRFDERQSGLVSTKQLGNLLRHLGINPTKEELQDLTIQIDPNVTGYLKLPDLLDMMSRIIMERNYDAQIEDAFRCFDKEN